MVGKLSLICNNYITDRIGQLIPVEDKKEVFCDVISISSKEFSNAGVLGLKPVIAFKIWTNEYNGEETVEYNDVRYSVYRTYNNSTNRTELYCEKKVGS